MSILENQKLVKSLIVGGTAFTIDKLYFKSTNLKNSMILAASMASATYVASVLSPKLPDLTNNLGGNSHFCLQINLISSYPIFFLG